MLPGLEFARELLLGKMGIERFSHHLLAYTRLALTIIHKIIIPDALFGLIPDNF